MTSKQVVPTAVQKAALVLKPGVTLRQVQDAMLAVEPITPEVPDFPPVPSKIVLTDEVKTALRRLPEVFAEVQPTKRRALTGPESKALLDERKVLNAITDLLTSRAEDIKVFVRHHMDVTAEKDGRANPETTQRDAHGHYVLCAPQNPERSNIPETAEAWSREYRNGTVTIDPSILLRMYEEGEITREVYLSMTREVRVFDEDKALKAALKAPGPVRDQILGAIKQMTKVGVPGSALFVRKQK